MMYGVAIVAGLLAAECLHRGYQDMISNAETSNGWIGRSWFYPGLVFALVALEAWPL